MTDTIDLTTEYLEKRAKFKRRAESNLNRCLYNYKQLKRCANRRIYAYDEQQIEKLLTKLRDGVDEVERAFRQGEPAGKVWVEL